MSFLTTRARELGQALEDSPQEPVSGPIANRKVSEGSESADTENL